MREIKFRAWLKEEQKMFTEEQHGTEYAWVTGEDGCPQVIWLDEPENAEYEDIELMQYTGLKDKNGKEIYEGDIVAWETGKEPGVQDCKMAVEFYFGQLGTVQTIPAINSTSEVIGNIYEAPDLLNATTVPDEPLASQQASPNQLSSEERK